MADNILFVFEGEKTEVGIEKSMGKYFFSNATVLIAAFCGEIYSLYNTLKKDEDLELFSILKEREQNKEILKDLDLSDVSQIYLFFDYDGHVPAACDKKLLKMLEFFNEETDKGKLYISYPMVESLRHFKTLDDYKELVSSVMLGKGYKRVASEEGKAQFRNFLELTEGDWKILNLANLNKSNYLVNGSYELPTILFSSTEIFNKQKEKHIVGGNVAVLSGFPLMLVDYHGVSNISKLI